VAELLAGWPSGVFGLLVAGLVVFPVLAPRLVHASARTDTTTLLGILPLSLSMGIAEWRLYGYRRRIDRLMRSTSILLEFGLRAALVLVGVLIEYLSGTALLLIGAATITSLTNNHPQWTSVPAYLGYLALGAGLFLSLLIQGCVGTVPVLGWCVGAVAAEFAIVVFVPGAPVLRVQLVVATGMALALLWHGTITLSRASRHAV
jgi:hypothetical protein